MPLTVSGIPAYNSERKLLFERSDLCDSYEEWGDFCIV